MSKMEQPQSADKKAYIDNEAKLAALKAKPVEDLTLEEFQALKGLKKENEGLVGKAQEEAGAEEQERKMYDEAKAEDAERKIYDEAKVEDTAREQAKDAEGKVALARDAAAQAEKDAAKAAEVLEGIKGVKMETKNSQGAEAEASEKIGQTDPRLEKYMGTIRSMLEKIKSLHADNEKIRATGKYADKSNVADMEAYIKQGKDAEGKNILDLPKKEYNESNYAYQRRVDKIREDFRKLVGDNAEILLTLAEAGRLGGSANGTLEGVSERLKGDKSFIKRILQLEHNRGGSFAGFIWGDVTGAAGADKNLYLEAVKTNPLNYQFGSKEWKSDPAVQKIALESGLNSAYLYKQSA